MHNHRNNNDQNNDACIWGVELDKNYSAMDVRDAMLRCFIQANGVAIAKGMDIQLPDNEKEKQMKLNELTEKFLRKSFNESGGDYDMPNKESIIAALQKLKEYALSQGHNVDMISTHAAGIMKLLDGLS